MLTLEILEGHIIEINKTICSNHIKSNNLNHILIVGLNELKDRMMELEKAEEERDYEGEAHYKYLYAEAQRELEVEKKNIKKPKVTLNTGEVVQLNNPEEGEEYLPHPSVFDGIDQMFDEKAATYEEEMKDTLTLASQEQLTNLVKKPISLIDKYNAIKSKKNKDVRSSLERDKKIQDLWQKRSDEIDSIPSVMDVIAKEKIDIVPNEFGSSNPYDFGSKAWLKEKEDRHAHYSGFKKEPSEVEKVLQEKKLKVERARAEGEAAAVDRINKILTKNITYTLNTNLIARLSTEIYKSFEED